MPPNDGNTLGSANVRITADATDLNAKVDQAKAKVAEIGPAANTAKTDADALFKSMIDDANKAADASQNVAQSVEGIGSSLGHANVFATVAVTTIGALAAIFKEAEERAKKVHDEMRRIYEEGEKAKASAGRVLDEIANPKDTLQRQLDAATKAYEDAVDTLHTKMYQQKGDQAKQFVQNEIDALTEKYNAALNTIEARWKESEKRKAEASAEAQDKLIERFIVGQQAQEDVESKARQKAHDEEMKMMEERLKMEQRISETRLRGIVQAQTALDRLYATQAAGFNGEGANNSLQGSIDALEIAVRGAAARMGGI